MRQAVNRDKFTVTCVIHCEEDEAFPLLPLPALTTSLVSERTCDVCADLRQKVDEHKPPNWIGNFFPDDSVQILIFPLVHLVDAVFFGLALIPDWL